MREKWETSDDTTSDKNDGQPVAQKISYIYEPTYKPKLLLKTPSLRALRNYNNLSLESAHDAYENLSFIPEHDNVDLKSFKDEAYSSTLVSNDSKLNEFANNYDMYDYTTTLRSQKTTASYNSSEIGSERNDMGSTTKLVSPKMEMSCQTCFKHFETVLCTISLAAGLGNLYRLPQSTLVYGGLPFLVAYVVLTILIGLPLLFLELGIGQLAQEGFIKSWRAIPFFKGVGYVKLIAGCLLGIYYPLYMGLSLYYIIWLPTHSIPFEECATVKMKTTGYTADAQNGQECLKKTFLTSPFDTPEWFGIFAGLLFVIWLIVTILSIRRTKSFIRSLSVLLFPVLLCMIALVVRAVAVADKTKGLQNLNTDFSMLKNSYIWYYAAIQVFFSTNTGFGTFITSAGIIYNKVNPKWTALGYIAVNLILGIGSVIICYIFSRELDNISLKPDEMPELHLLSLMYTIMVKNDNKEESKIWAIVAFSAILLSGFISMVTITYTLLKAITVQNKRRLKWWQSSIVLSFLGLLLGCACLLKPNFQIIRLLDHYIVGNFIIISVIIEVFAFIAFYGTEQIKSDFEFMMGHILAKFWLMLWFILPVLLTGIFVWALICYDFDSDISPYDAEWIYATGWGIVLTAAIFIFAIGIHTMSQQDGYTILDKFKAALKPSHNWGPKDPILRHNWVQWNTKTKQGERDFTLKRKGTREYTRSVKREAKKSKLGVSPSNTLKQDQNQNNRISTNSVEYIEPYYTENEMQENHKPLRLTSLVDSLEPTPIINVIMTNKVNNHFTTNINPLARTHTHETIDGSNSEGYGTFRRGPYLIPDSNNITHVCHRRFSQGEEATEL